MAFTETGFKKLPNELFQQIASYCSGNDVLSLASCNRKLRDQCHQPIVYQKCFEMRIANFIVNKPTAPRERSRWFVKSSRHGDFTLHIKQLVKNLNRGKPSARHHNVQSQAVLSDTVYWARWAVVASRLMEFELEMPADMTSAEKQACCDRVQAQQESVAAYLLVLGLASIARCDNSTMVLKLRTDRLRANMSQERHFESSKPIDTNYSTRLSFCLAYEGLVGLRIRQLESRLRPNDALIDSGSPPTWSHDTLSPYPEVVARSLSHYLGQCWVTSPQTQALQIIGILTRLVVLSDNSARLTHAISGTQQFSLLRYRSYIKIEKWAPKELPVPFSTQSPYSWESWYDKVMQSTYLPHYFEKDCWMLLVTRDDAEHPLPASILILVHHLSEGGLILAAMTDEYIFSGHLRVNDGSVQLESRSLRTGMVMQWIGASTAFGIAGVVGEFNDRMYPFWMWNTAWT